LHAGIVEIVADRDGEGRTDRGGALAHARRDIALVRGAVASPIADREERQPRARIERADAAASGASAAAVAKPVSSSRRVGWNVGSVIARHLGWTCAP